jgi:glycerol uptake facilitator protein
MVNPYIGEFMGTMFLIILGDGVVANVLLAKSKGENAGWIVITTGWAFAVMVGVFVSSAFGSAAAHINPAVTFGFALAGLTGGGFGGWGDVPGFVIAQILGAFVGAIIVWLAYMPHWEPTKDAGLKLAVFSTGPAIRNPVLNVVTEVIGTFVLLMGVAAIFSAGTGGISDGLGPFLVGALVWGIGLSLGGPTGYAINPARDLGPRIAHQILPIAGKGDSDWGYGWIPVVAPIIGGLLAGALILVSGI